MAQKTLMLVIGVYITFTAQWSNLLWWGPVEGSRNPSFYDEQCCITLVLCKRLTGTLLLKVWTWKIINTNLAFTILLCFYHLCENYQVFCLLFQTVHKDTKIIQNIVSLLKCTVITINIPTSKREIFLTEWLRALSWTKGYYHTIVSYLGLDFWSFSCNCMSGHFTGSRNLKIIFMWLISFQN